MVFGIFDNCMIGLCYNSFFPPYFPKANLIWSIVIFLMLISNDNSIELKNFLENSFILKEIGKISFGIYLWHISSIRITKDIFGFYSLEVLGILDTYLVETLICILISYLFYFGFERLMIKMGQNICDKLDNIFRPKLKYIEENSI